MTDRPVADREPLSAEGLARQRWYHGGRPWFDRPGMIYAGSEDPHVGTFVADCGDDLGLMPDDDPRAAPAVVAAIANLIVHQHNANLTAARAHPDEAGLRQAAWQRVNADILAVIGDRATRNAVSDLLNHHRAALAQPAVPVAGAEDETSIRAAIVEWLGPQRMSIYFGKDIDRMVEGVVIWRALRAAQPEDDGLDRSGVDDVGEPMRVFITADDIERALKELGPIGDLGEAYVKTAAMIAVHILRGGRVEYVPPALATPPSERRDGA